MLIQKEGKLWKVYINDELFIQFSYTIPYKEVEQRTKMLLKEQNKKAL